jgi:hypothetical protein
MRDAAPAFIIRSCKIAGSFTRAMRLHVADFSCVFVDKFEISSFDIKVGEFITAFNIWPLLSIAK